MGRRLYSLGWKANDVFVTTARTSQDQVSTCSASRSSCPLPLPTVITEDNQIIGGGTRGTSTRWGKIRGLSSRYNEGQLDQSLSSQRSVSVLQGQTKTFIYEGNPPIPSIICWAQLSSDLTSHISHDKHIIMKITICHSETRKMTLKMPNTIQWYWRLAVV